MTRAGLDIVIVSWRCEELLRRCLASLHQHPASVTMRIHVVDNASGDGTAEMVAAEFPEVELTVNNENLGFSAANNIALRRSRGDYVLVLNPDTRLTESALDALLGLLAAKSEVGICGPRLELADGTFDHASRRSFPTPLSALGHFSGVGRRLDAGPLAAYRAPGVESGPVDAVNGAFMLIRRSALDQVGLFDEDYWMYMEDLDLCYRFKQAGWGIWFESSVTVIHEKAGTSGPERSPRLNRAFHAGMLRFYRAHYAPQRPKLVNGAVYVGIGVKLALSTIRSLARRALARGR
jgi:N-acetylglucosaminyl-diphospho-decaprenol L-rhamnosyltransferase